MKKENLKSLNFLGGALLAGGSIRYYNEFPIVAFVGIMVGAFFIIKAFD